MAIAGREALDALDVGLGELLEELPRVGGERLDVAALALGVDRVERERRLARAARAGEDDELARAGARRSRSSGCAAARRRRRGDPWNARRYAERSRALRTSAPPHRYGHRQACASSAARRSRHEVGRGLEAAAHAEEAVRDVRRGVASRRGIVECVVDAGWTTSVRTSPRLTACVTTRSAFEHLAAARRARPGVRRELEREERAVRVHLSLRERVAGMRRRATDDGRARRADAPRDAPRASPRSRTRAPGEARTCAGRARRATPRAATSTPPKPFTIVSRARVDERARAAARRRR